MKWRPVASFVLLASASGNTLAGDCLKYEPAKVHLSGTIARETFPGPPNYESVASGDAAETIWVLRLSKPICTVSSSSDEINEAENDQSELQLVLEPAQYKRYRALVGRRVTATGTLFHAISGHHHKTLLLTTEALSGIA